MKEAKLLCGACAASHPPRHALLPVADAAKQLSNMLVRRWSLLVSAIATVAGHAATVGAALTAMHASFTDAVATYTAGMAVLAAAHPDKVVQLASAQGNMLSRLARLEEDRDKLLTDQARECSVSASQLRAAAAACASALGEGSEEALVAALCMGGRVAGLAKAWGGLACPTQVSVVLRGEALLSDPPDWEGLQRVHERVPAADGWTVEGAGLLGFGIGEAGEVCACRFLC